MVSSPADVVALDATRERTNLEQALSGLVEHGAIDVTWLEDASLPSLLHALQRGPFHIFHYIGHGEYDRNVEDGVLLLEDERGGPRRVTGRDLGTILAPHKTLRLAVLNACDGARAAADDPFAGVATSLVQRQIPAVIAMQFAISDRAAVLFAGEFYWKLADCGVVDSSLAFARQALYASGNEVEWATPVLFMRVSDGQIFDVPETPVERPGAIGDDGRSWWQPLRAVAVAAVVAIGAAAAAFALFASDASPPPPPPPPPPSVAPPPNPPPPPPARWTLRTAIPASIRSSCESGADSLVVPGNLTPLVHGGERVRFKSSLACNELPVPAELAQYSLAASDRDLDRYMQWRANSAGLDASKLTSVRCGEAEKASNRWERAGQWGHSLDAGGATIGRVICYRENGMPRIEWIDTESLVYGFAQGSGATALLRWWKTAAGPRWPRRWKGWMGQFHKWVEPPD